MAVLWPIYIPSKRRAGIGRLASLLAFWEIKATLVVEPQEKAEYSACYPFHSIMALPEDERGLAYSRNQIQQVARLAGHSWYWMIDDDVSKFYAAESGKMVPCGARLALLGAQEAAGKSVGQISLDYQQFAWRAKGIPVCNSYCDVVVANRTDLGLVYDFELVLKEDRDYTMQVIASGLDTVRVTRFAFTAPKNGSNPGGLQALYRQRGRERLAVERLRAKWPWCVEHQTKPDGREDARIAWRKIRRPLAPKV